MNEAATTTPPALLQAHASIQVQASPDATYALISDLPRSAEWSAECIGGEWISGEPAAAGSVFRGTNERGPGVVSWAPVVRGTWTTEAEIIEAEPPRAFRWAMRNKAGKAQDSVWSFELTSADGGTLLTHRFRMGHATEGIRGIIADMDLDAKVRFFTEWQDKVAADLAATIRRIKDVLDQTG